MKFGEKLFQTKLLSRLSHKVYRLLSFPALLRNFIIDGPLNQGGSILACWSMIQARILSYPVSIIHKNDVLSMCFSSIL